MKKFLSLVLALVMVLSLGVTAGAVDFTDEAAITKEEAVGVLAGLGIINGYEAADGTFSFAPNGNITRGAAAKIICMIKLGTKVAGILSCETAPFKDVAKDSTFAPYIAYCVNEGIVSGYPDGTYKPGNPVTGYAFTKMLLNALGIKGDYEGANYGVNVALAANEAKLFEGMDADTAYAANCIREDACQLAFNALNYAPNGKTSKYVVKNAAGKTLYNGTDALTALVMKESADTNTLELVESADGSLGAKNFALTKGTKTDDFGRASTTYTNGKAATEKGYVLYASFANNAKLTYTAATTEGKVWTALGFTKAADEVTLNVYTNGATEPVVKTLTKGDSAKLGAQGTLLEIYATDDAKVFNAYEVETFVYTIEEGDITKAVAATATADAQDAYITIKNATATDKTFKTAAFKKDDVVLYTQTAGKIVNVVKAASVVGKVTATAGDNSYMRVDGVQYKLAAKNAATIGTTAGYKYVKNAAEYTYYLDNYGNVIAAVEGKAADVKAQYIYVTQIAAKAAVSKGVAGGDLFSGSTNVTAAQAQAKVVDLATGEISVKNVAIVKNTAGKYVYADKTGAATTDEVDDIDITTVNGIYEYYTLADGSIVFDGAASGTDVNVKKDTAAVATGVYANSATKLTVITLTKDAKKDYVVTSASVSTVTGIANFPNVTAGKDYAGAIVTKDKNNIASEIVAVVDTAPAVEAVNYAVYKGAGETTAEGTKVSFYQDGAVKEYILDKSFDDQDKLVKNAVVTLTLKDGKLAAAEDAKVLCTATVKSVDASYVLLNTGVVYFDKTYSVVDADASYAADTLAADDKVVVYSTGTKAQFIVVDNGTATVHVHTGVECSCGQFFVSDADELYTAYMAADDGAIIHLAAGTYENVEFAKGAADDMTIIGEEGTYVKKVRLMETTNYSAPNGLTLKNITFNGEGIKAVADEINDLSVVDCTFTDGAVIHINAECTTDGLTVEGCVFEETDYATTGEQTAILVQGSAKNVVISGNVITNCEKNAIQLAGPIDEDIVIEGNTIDGVDDRAIRLAGLAATAEVTIASNTFAGIANELVKADGITEGAVIKYNGAVQTPNASGVVLIAE